MRQFFLDMKHKIENLLKPMTIACVICMPEIQCHCHPCLHWTCQLHLALHRPLAVVLPTKIWKIGMYILTFDVCHLNVICVDIFKSKLLRQEQLNTQLIFHELQFECELWTWNINWNDFYLINCIIKVCTYIWSLLVAFKFSNEK